MVAAGRATRRPPGNGRGLGIHRLLAHLRPELLCIGEPLNEHFSVDATLLQAWASHASLERIDGQDDPPQPPSGPGEGFGATKDGRKRGKGDFRGVMALLVETAFPLCSDCVRVIPPARLESARPGRNKTEVAVPFATYPEGYTYPPAAAGVNGIVTERALAEGQPARWGPSQGPLRF